MQFSQVVSHAGVGLSRDVAALESPMFLQIIFHPGFWKESLWNPWLTKLDSGGIFFWSVPSALCGWINICSHLPRKSHTMLGDSASFFRNLLPIKWVGSNAPNCILACSPHQGHSSSRLLWSTPQMLNPAYRMVRLRPDSSCGQTHYTLTPLLLWEVSILALVYQ